MANERSFDTAGSFTLCHTILVLMRILSFFFVNFADHRRGFSINLRPIFRASSSLTRLHLPFFSF